MELIRIPRIMQETSKGYLLKNKKIGFIPTMGALHEGHLSLVKRAKSDNDVTVVSIFVNPIQFGISEDFNTYPRDMEGDMDKLQKEGADILFMPESKFIYPDGFSTYIEVKDLSDKMCGAFRAGHFKGVATIVCKLFNIVMPASAYFGQKDFQQTVVVKRMVDDLNMDLNIVVCPTQREADGLAMSSRNAYLNSEQRRAATVIYKTLLFAGELIKSGSSSVMSVKKAMYDMLKAEPLVSEIHYAGLYDTDSLDELNEFKKQNLLAIAVKIGSTRLIDNIIVEL
jgi:pantoate--beta-alanine ligase